MKNRRKGQKNLAAVKFSKLTGVLVRSSNFAFADNHSGNNLGLICWFDCLVGILLVPTCDVVGEKPVDGKPHKRLDKKHLREIGKRQVVAYQAEPTAQKVNYVKSLIVRIIKEIS